MSLAEEFDDIFRGHRECYGYYGSEKYSPEKNKMEISHSARTVRAPVTTQLWEEHLSGERPLGIVPIDTDWNVHWGAIDVDDYELDHAELIKRVEDLPCVVCRTKSGGAHIYMFAKQAVSAELMQTAMQNISASLSLARCEIYPKQRSLLEDRGDLGNWLNMPYFGGDLGRVALRSSGLGMSSTEFLQTARELRDQVDVEFLEKWASAKPQDKSRKDERLVSRSTVNVRTSDNAEDRDDPLWHAPPCLQQLVSEGFPEGTRNNGFLNICIYLKRRFPDDWQSRVHEYSRAPYFIPARPADEVRDVIKRLSRREYQYLCRQAPIVDVCRASICRSRRFGVGAAEDIPRLSGLAVLDVDPPLWFVDIEGRRVELNTKDLQYYTNFQRACMDQLHIAFLNIKQGDWIEILNEAMQSVVRIEAPPGIGDKGRFADLVQEWLTDRRSANEPDEIITGLPWLNEETREYCFLLKHLEDFLAQMKFTRYHSVEIVQRLKELGGRYEPLNVQTGGRKKELETWRLKKDVFDEADRVDPPKVRGDQI